MKLKNSDLPEANISGSIFIKDILYQIQPGVPVVMIVNISDIGQCILHIFDTSELESEYNVYGLLSPISNYQLNQIYKKPLISFLNNLILLKLDSFFCFSIQNSWRINAENRIWFSIYLPTKDLIMEEKYKPDLLRDLFKLLKKSYNKATKGKWYWEERGANNDTITLFAESDVVSTFLGKEMRGHPMNLLNSDKKEWDYNGSNNREFILNMKNSFENMNLILSDIEYDNHIINNTLKVLNI